MEKEEKILKSSIKMYNNTIKEMEKLGKNTSLPLVIAAREDIKDKIKGNKSYENKNLKESLIKNKQPITDSLLLEVPFIVNPIFSNRFLLKFKDVPEWLVCSAVDNNIDSIIVVYREIENYSPFEYFTTHKNNIKGNMIIERLSSVGAVVRRDTYKIKSMSYLFENKLDYETNKDMKITVGFKYSHKNIEIIGGNKIYGSTD